MAGTTGTQAEGTRPASTVIAVGARLEQVVPGASVRGLEQAEGVSVVSADWIGTTALSVTYWRASGEVKPVLLYRADEGRLSVVDDRASFAFDADGGEFRLAAEARRIRLAHLFDPRLAVHLSVLEPLPHQIQAVYGEMLPRHPLRFALCDDPA